MTTFALIEGSGTGARHVVGVTAFESHRAHLLRVAYGTLGSVADAEDAVQEAWLRLARLEDPGAIEDLRAWLTRVVGRLALDGLRRAHRTRESYFGEWLPEPVVNTTAAAGPTAPDDPADRVTLDESVTLALLVVLESLTPAERTAFVLHDVFGMPFEEVSEVVGRAPTAVRQLAARARRHVDEARPRHPATPLVNGWPGLVMRDSRGVLTVMSFTVDGGRIVGIETMRNPDKLTHVDLL